jgi:hypothetical protein
MSRLSLSAALEPSLSTTDSGLAAVVGVTYTPPDHAEPRPSSIVCVIDVSGSMQLPATVQSADGDGGDGELDDAGLDRLDLVKHAVSTVIATLQPQDQLGLVTYSDRSEVVLPLTPMDGGGVAAAREALKRMQPGGATNLWAGLSSGLELSAAAALPLPPHRMLARRGWAGARTSSCLPTVSPTKNLKRDISTRWMTF